MVTISRSDLRLSSLLNGVNYPLKNKGGTVLVAHGLLPVCASKWIRVSIWVQALAHSSPHCLIINACPLTVLSCVSLGSPYFQELMDWRTEDPVTNRQLGCALPGWRRELSCVKGTVLCHIPPRSPNCTTSVFHLFCTRSNNDHSDQYN